MRRLRHAQPGGGPGHGREIISHGWLGNASVSPTLQMEQEQIACCHAGF